MKDGTYAYRFSGFVAKDDNFRRTVSYHLVGIGTMSLKAGSPGTISGYQSSSITALSGVDAKMRHTKFELTGTYKPITNGHGLHEAEVDMTLVEPADISQNLAAKFNFRPIGADRLWLISTSTRNNTTGTDANEVVSGEAVLIS